MKFCDIVGIHRSEVPEIAPVPYHLFSVCALLPAIEAELFCCLLLKPDWK